MIPNLTIVRPNRSAKKMVPRSVMFNMSIKLYMIGSLVWDYADTVLDLVRQAKISETKKISRELRELRDGYLAFRAQCGSDTLEEEAHLGLMFEELNQKRMNKLYKDLCVEIKYTTQLDETWRTICASALTALTVLDAMKMYARHCEKRIDSYGAQRIHSVLQDEFVRLGVLLGKFLQGKCSASLVTRKKVAEELYVEILTLEALETDGED